VNNTQREQQQLALAQGIGRVDLYGSIHKALRMMMCDTLVGLGRLDVDDEHAVLQGAQRVFDLLEICHAHLNHENRFVHPAMHARDAGSSDAAACEHAEHERHIVQLSRMAGALVKTEAGQRGPVLMGLYHALSLFVADNFRHMVDEETRHNPVLWAHYSDAELMALHDELVASIVQPEMLATLRWMVPACNPSERAQMLCGMQAQAPQPAFEAVLDTVRPHLDAREWASLARALGRAPQPGLVAAVG
jgi:hypothetical protein